jgi:hypothetical protein
MCRTAAREGYAGIIPSMENFTYENPHAFDARWGPQGSAGWDDLLVRVTRLSFREFAARPGLDDAGFRDALRAELFDAESPGTAIDDLLALHRLLNRWDGWTWRGGIVKAPAAPVDLKALEPKAREALERDVIPALRDLRAIRERALASAGQEPASRGQKTLARMAAIAGWVLDRWKGIDL